jgi:hypothetical protein
MKIFILLCLTAIIGTGSFLAATTLQHKMPALAVGFGVWICFLVYLAKRISKQ